jgi:hypothetical protein
MVNGEWRHLTGFMFRSPGHFLHVSPSCQSDRAHLFDRSSTSKDNQLEAVLRSMIESLPNATRDVHQTLDPVRLRACGERVL